MDMSDLKLIFDIGETVAVEFKRCGGSIESAKVSGLNGGINNEFRNKIMELMKESPSINMKQIAETLNIDRRNVESHVRALKKQGWVEREGAKKNGRWVTKGL